ncbi:MAG: GAF domain-containing protein [Janthinobacterium lividum]|jgi:GAF domain-containing protein
MLLPPNETARLQTLHYYDILHTLHEPVFDEFVALAARIFSLPISLIALVAEEQVHYKANYGMPGNHVQRREETLCATAIMQDKAVVYTDLATETYPLITARAAEAARTNQIRFYAAAPLCMPNESIIGSLCIIDRTPRHFSDDEKRVLEQLGYLVSQTIVARHTCLSQYSSDEWEWPILRIQVQEEVQALTALVRYLFARNGTHIPVPADSLNQVARRLVDLDGVLAPYCQAA